MTKQEKIAVKHKNVHVALAAAQAEMGKALKQSSNPHFRSKYADLSNVMDACLPALNAHGISVTQPVETSEFGHTVKTILTHGESDTFVECTVPLLLGKQDMQGLGSAMTYSRRFGLMAMAGIAPEDDDGNAAAESAKTLISPEQYVKIRDTAQEAGVAEKAICGAFKAPSLEQLPAASFQSAMKKLQATIASKAKERAENKLELEGDEIPY